MDKITYLAELAEGLARWVPERERQDILRYYAEYFEEAGPDREAEVIAELGDPWALSCRLAVEGGFVTEAQANSWTPPKKKRWTWLLAVGITAAVLVWTVTGITSAAASVLGFLSSRTVTYSSDAVLTTPLPYAIIDSVEEAEAISGVTYIGNYGGLWAMEDGNLDPFYAIDAKISMGNITITGGDDFMLVIQQYSDLGGYSVKWEMQGDTLKLRDSGPGNFNVGLDGLGNLMSGNLMEQNAVDVIITVPWGSYLQKVAAKTDFGDVRILDLDVEVKVTGETSMGNVEGYEIRTAEKVELKTAMGNVTFGAGELYDGMDIELKTNLGDVEVNLACYERDCEYELETDLGNVSINGVDQGDKVKRKGNMVYKLDAESDLGNVAVYFFDDRWQ